MPLTPDHRPLGLFVILTTVAAFLLTDWLLSRWLATNQRPATLLELHANADGVLGKLRGLAGLSWLPRLLGNGDLSSTRFVFLGAFGVASALLAGLFASLCWHYLRTGTSDPSLDILAAGAFGTFLGFAANAQNIKNKTTPNADPDQGTTTGT